MDCIICYENLNDKLLVLSCCNNIIHQKCLYLCNNINCVECKSNIYFTLDVKYKDILYNLNNNKINILIKNKDGYNALHNAIIKQKKKYIKINKYWY